MPYRWTDTPERSELELWPHQSLTGQGFVWFIGATAFMLCLPLLAVLGSPVLWVLLAFFALAMAGIWQAIMRNRRHREVREHLTLTPEQLHLTHASNDGSRKEWSANPYWVTARLRHDGPVESYLTLRGSNREVELGRFLTPDERKALYVEVENRLRAATRGVGP